MSDNKPNGQAETEKALNTVDTLKPPPRQPQGDSQHGKPNTSK